MAHDTDVNGATAQLLEDFDKVVRDSESLLRSLANVSGEKALALRESVQANLDNAKARLHDLREATGIRVGAAARQADAYVHDNPWTAIGLAAAVGVIIGLIASAGRRD